MDPDWHDEPSDAVIGYTEGARPVNDSLFPPIVVVGCGPSAEHVPWSPVGKYDIATVNDALLLVEDADYAAFNDLPALLRMKQTDISKARKIVLPRYLHNDPKAEALTFWEDAVDDLLKTFHEPFAQLDVQVYTLHTDPTVNSTDFDDLPYPHFGRCRSTSDSLIAFLLTLGYREFMTTGIEWDGTDGHHPDLPAGMSKRPKWRQAIWRHTLARIKSTDGAKVELWNAS